MQGVDVALSNAWGELTLVLFTTLGPSATLAYLIMEVPLFSDRLDTDLRYRLGRCLSMPLALCLVGFIFSAAHLSNPANALYVFARTGFSPLSNEVTSTVVFFACAALMWLLTFAEKENLTVRRVLIVATTLSGCATLLSIGFAYHVHTIITWKTPFVPAIIIGSAFVGGPLIALVGFSLAKWEFKTIRYEKALVIGAGIALVLVAVLSCAQGALLMQTSNSLYEASELVPFYFLLLAIAVALAAFGCGLDGYALVRTGHLSWRRAALAAGLSLMGLFILRFMFYMSHMTVGLAV